MYHKHINQPTYALRAKSDNHRLIDDFIGVEMWSSLGWLERKLNIDPSVIPLQTHIPNTQTQHAICHLQCI